MSKRVLLILILCGLTNAVLADPSNLIGEAILWAFLPAAFLLLVLSVALAALMHFVFNRMAAKRRKSFWRILICVLLIHLAYIWVEIETAFFEHHFSNFVGWLTQFLLVYVLLPFLGGFIGFKISPLKVEE